jgi:hypothetical protein
MSEDCEAGEFAVCDTPGDDCEWCNGKAAAHLQPVTPEKPK